MSVINTNTKALVAQESMRATNLSLSQAMERLSTGKKINSAKDDAAGLAITNRMTSQVRGMAKAINNTNDAISMSQTAEGALGNVGDILQRMRELAVQSGSGTMNDSDRSTLQMEVSQLKLQIDEIANKTNHNNIKLLDGTAQNVVIQTGINAGDTMKIGFDSVKTKDIGIGSKASLSSAGGTYASGGANDALSPSALYLNGVAVGASYATDDNASNADGSASAIAKVIAINRVSNLSGVYAKVLGTTVAGAEMTAASVVSSGTVTINGVATDTFATSLDTSLTRKTVVSAINAKSALTGVVATDTGDDKLGVTLFAADGRNIDMVSASVTAATSGLKSITQTTYVGSYSLYTVDGRDITVGSKTGASSVEAQSGLRFGTYKADTATFTSFARTNVSLVPTAATNGLLDASSMTINGVQIGAALNTDDTSSVVTSASVRSASAIAIAAAINKSSDQTGVKASATPNTVRANSDTAFTAHTAVYTIGLNDVVISVNTTTINGVIDTINSKSSLTGVVASQWGSGLQLTAADGRNIALTSSVASAVNIGLGGLTIGTSAASTSGSGVVVFTSAVTLSSDKAFTVKAGNTGITNLENLGFRQGTYGATQDSGFKVASLDISSLSGASQAITTIDAAINTVSNLQARSGSFNNRLDVVVNNLQESSQNIQASRSRILDTDYAVETTNLAKQQIISQAATAMLAQANQSSQSILSLLK
jgi:flagellin